MLVRCANASVRHGRRVGTAPLSDIARSYVLAFVPPRLLRDLPNIGNRMCDHGGDKPTKQDSYQEQRSRQLPAEYSLF